MRVIDLHTEVVVLGCGPSLRKRCKCYSPVCRQRTGKGAWSGDLLHPEKVSVEGHRIVEVVGVEAYVSRGSH